MKPHGASGPGFFGLILCVFLGVSWGLNGQGTAFLYQGRLNDGGQPANGIYDFEFSLYGSASGNDLAGGPVTNLALAVNAGLFETNLDFGPVFQGASYWLAIGVRTNGGAGGFTPLTPRQPVLPVPYASFAGSASNLTGTLAGGELSGNYPGQLTLNNINNVISGAFNGGFTGLGSGLINLNGSQITSGTVADARLSTNVPLLNANQTFSGSNTFLGVQNFGNRNNNFTGSFFGNGLVGWIPETSASVQAVRDTGYLLLSPALTTVLLPPTSQLNVGDVVRVAGGGLGGWLVAQNAGQSIVGDFLTASNNSWQPVESSSIPWSSIVCSADGSHFLAGVGQANGIYDSLDSGQTWHLSDSTHSISAVGISAVGNVFFGASSNGQLIYSTNLNTGWVLATGAPYMIWSGLAVSGTGAILVGVSSQGYIVYSWNQGVTWAQANVPGYVWTAVAGSADGTRFTAVSSQGALYTSANSGVGWVQQTQAPGQSWTSIASSSDGSKLVAVAASGAVYTSSNYGVTWTSSASAPVVAWSGVACSRDGGKIFAVANGGGIYASANFGVTWSQEPAPSEAWHAVACAADGSLAAAVSYIAGINFAGIYRGQSTQQLTTTTPGASGSVSGGQGDSVELQYIGNNQFMPLSFTGVLWSN